MGDADETYPMRRARPVRRAPRAGRRPRHGLALRGTIHGDAMPWLNRYVGNPILTGHAQPVLRREGLRRPLRHACGAPRRAADARPALDGNGVRVRDGLQGVPSRASRSARSRSTTTRASASPSSTASATRGATCASCCSTARAGCTSCRASSCSRSAPSGMIVLAAGPVDVLRPHVADPHDARVHRAVLLGMQIVQLGIFARAFAAAHSARPTR